MKLNDKQHQLIVQFANKFADHSTTGHIHPNCHLTDVRKLIEDCLQAQDNKMPIDNQNKNI